MLLIYIALGLVIILWQTLKTFGRPVNKERLINLLEKAEKLAGQFTGGYSGQFLSAQEFHEALKTSIDKYKNGDISQLDILYFWFAPTCSWDDFVGKEGEKTGNEIFELIEKLKKKKNV